MNYFLLTIDALSEGQKSDSGSMLFILLIIFLMAILIIWLYLVVSTPRQSERFVKASSPRIHQASVEEVWQVILELKAKQKRSFSASYISRKIEGSNTRQVREILIQLAVEHKLEWNSQSCVEDENFIIV